MLLPDSPPGTDADNLLLEREHELETIDRAVTQVATASRGALIMLEGPAGAGKSALVRHAVAQADEMGVRTLVAIGSELEAAFPFGIARQLLEGELIDCEQERAARLLSGPAAPAGTVLAYAVSAGPDDTVPRIADHALFWFAAHLAAERPLLLVVDDAHWADVASLGFLRYLSRRLGDLPMVLLVSARPVDARHAPAALTSMLTDDQALLLRPAALSPGAVDRLCSALLGQTAAPEFVDVCARVTGGNPFLVTGLLHELGQREILPTADVTGEVAALAPDAVQRRTTGWLSALSPAANRLARSLAILGQAELPLLAQHAQVTVDAARDACVELERAGLLQDSQIVQFAHPLIATATAATIAASELSEAHLEAARLLAAKATPVEAAAVHLLHVRPAANPWASDVLVRAGDAALGRGAPREAIGFLDRALSEPLPDGAQGHTLLRLGLAQLRERRLEDATTALRGALEHALAPEERAAGLTNLAHALYLAGNEGEAFDMLERASAEEPDETRRWRIEGNAFTLGLLDPARAPGVRERLHHYRRRALEGAIDEPVILALAGGEAVLGSEPVGPGVTLVRRAFDRGLTAFGDHALVFGWAVCALEAADLDTEALAHIDRALDQARPHGDAATIAHLLSYRTFIVCHAGRLAEAEADGRTALDLVQRFAGDVSFPLGLLDVLIERNQVEEAWRLASTPEMRGSAQRVAMVRLVSARVAVAAGEDKAGALAQLMQAGAELDELELRQPRFAPWRALAAPLAAELGQRELAQRLCGELAELAQASGAGTATALAARVQGALTEDLDTLAEACDAAGRTADVLEHAESLTALGTLQLKRGLRDAAKETLREALAVADEAGALRLREVARKALVTAGGRPRRAALRGVDALTPSELQVARLAAGGLSNRDISDTLFVALKTVEQHLARTYAKLGIPGRQQLAQALQ